MKCAARVLVAISASSLLALPAAAQISSRLEGSDRLAGPGTQAAMFLRIPLGEARERTNTPRFGFGLFTGCGAAMGLASERNRDACDAAPVRSLEFSAEFNNEPWALSFGSAGRRIDFINWSPLTGNLSLAEGAGQTDWLWIGLGVVGVIGIAAALAEDDEPLLCTGNTIPNPISGECEPLVLG
jgi:hypothetical protein